MKKYIKGDVDLSGLYLNKIPDFLSDVGYTGFFKCDNNNLKSLEGMSKFNHLDNKGIICNNNKLYLDNLNYLGDEGIKAD